MTQLDENGRENPDTLCKVKFGRSGKELFDVLQRTDSNYYRIEEVSTLPLVPKFKSFTDHEALKYVFNDEDPQGIIDRSISIFCEYDFEVVCRPGPGNKNADYPSLDILQGITLSYCWS